MNFASFTSFVELFENGRKPAYPYLYLDDKGFVTIGTGLMFSNSNELIRANLAFTINGKGTQATDDDISKAFQKVKEASPGLSAESYQSLTNITADSNRLAGLFYHRLKNAQTEAVKWFEKGVKDDYAYKKFDELPENVQYAVIDMSFNMGIRTQNGKPRGLLKFQQFKEYLHKGDWVNAAEQSYRPDCKKGSRRNSLIYDWIYMYSTEALNAAFSNTA